MKRIIQLAVFVLTITQIAISQEQETKVYLQKDVVITASRQPESQGNVTQKIDVIADSAINAIVISNRNIAEAIQYQPGNAVNVLSRNDANWGTYGGIGPKYCTYMLQGLPIDAFVDPMSLDLSAVDRIEVQRGPASVLYPNYLSQDFAGSQSPLAGTINLILKEKVENQQTWISTSLGSYKTLNGQFYHQDRTRNFNYFVGTSYETSNYTNYGTDHSWLNIQKNPEYKTTKLFGGATLFVGDNDRHKITLFVNKTEHSGDAGRVYRGFNHDYNLLNAGYSLMINDRINLQAHMGLRTYDRTWQESNFGIIDTLKSNNGVYQNIVPIDVLICFRHGSDNLLTLGMDYQDAEYFTWSDPMLGYKQYGNKSNAKQAGVFAQEEVRFDALTLRGGLRYSYIENTIALIDGNAPGKNFQSWNSVLWSAGAKYRVNEQISVYANGGNSFITPGLKSVGGTIKLTDRGVVGKNGQLPNPDLKPESGIGIDAGADAELPMNFGAAIRGFLLIIDKAILDNAVSQNPSQSQSINAGKSTSTGFELEVNQQLCSELRWFVNYTYMKTKVENKLNSDLDGTEVTFTPGNVVNMGVDLTLPFGLRVHPYVNYGTEYYDSNSKSGRSQFKQGAVLNISASYLFAKGTDYGAEVFVQFYNVTDNRYEMPWQFKNPGVSATGGIRVTL